jgi:hypothetical protein
MKEYGHMQTIRLGKTNLQVSRVLACINRGPLGRGLLTGKFHANSTFAENDMRRGWGWNFSKGRPAERLRQLESLREVAHPRRAHPDPGRPGLGLGPPPEDDPHSRF